MARITGTNLDNWKRTTVIAALMLLVSIVASACSILGGSDLSPSEFEHYANGGIIFVIGLLCYAGFALLFWKLLN